MTLEQLRVRRLNKMSVQELDSLNVKLVGKGPNWLTGERMLVCGVIGQKLSKLFQDRNEWYLGDQ
jgi:hypothetical protein